VERRSGNRYRTRHLPGSPAHAKTAGRRACQVSR
jgi:hypothetical protein